MDINGSLAFVAVVDCGSFAGAARELGVPRSTVSARVAALEARLGVRLLRRSTRRIALTDEGEAWHASVASAIATLRAAEQRGLTRGETLSGTIRLSVPLDFPDTVLADAIAAFLDSHPRVRVEVRATNDVVDFVGDKFDLAIRGGKPGSNDAVARRIASFRMAAFASPAWLARRGVGDRADHAMSVPDSFAHLDLLAFSPRADRAASAPQARVVANSFGLLKQMAIRGKGVATLPAHLCAEALAAGTLVEIPPPLQDATQQGLYLVYPSRGDMSARARAFAQHLGETLERIAVAAQSPR
ncbi:DNA-binding transcriptional LysR family regulator [Paraburkholderia tropica]|uniref:DNA-binding transcriptional regulator, LysR family n=1 Tax=Paraburkholderia tropica TaxID=92647 RepID=A0AAQ1JYU5_9BURK|nr:LysR family transcriptional regulator [Paraburkholderia tropica]MBB3003941.1 DNA-binding transcriptional LysR family regulator [Paraburkholderia tropica]MBB6323445.1 DNA-binding transcriptional LysR family regulator [Paraburkholderia tropica]RQN34314.1 LysR family transcriptional regulator [Paraburkholderia tropica]SEK15277.1 DNA-binding transcriptional regulator, LysR family [Paraburkholderia tropica]